MLKPFILYPIVSNNRRNKVVNIKLLAHILR